MKCLSFASSFLPQNFWFIIGATLSMLVFFIGISFWAAGRFGDSKVWVVGGMFIGGFGAASGQFVLLPFGLTVGAVIGCVLSIVIAAMQR